MLTKEDVKQCLIEALRSEEGQEVLIEAMAQKIELTFGVNCRDPKKRDQLRENMKFLAVFHQQTRKGAERLFWWLVSIGFAGALAWLGIRSDFWK